MIQTESKSMSIIESAVNKVRSIVVSVKSAADYGQAGEQLKDIKAVKEQIDLFFDEDIADANKLHKSLTAKKKAFCEPLNALEASLKNARIAWSNEQERLRQIEQEMLDADAKKKADEEKQKLENKAKKADARGDTETAEALREKKDAVMTHTPIAAPRVEKTEGIKARKEWRAEVTDLAELVLEVSVGRVPITILEVKQAEINALAKAYKDSMKINGLRFYEKTIEVV